MKYIFKYMKVYLASIIFGVGLKILGAFIEFLIPYVLEHLIDDVAPTSNLKLILIWGAIMIGISILVRELNVWANRTAVKVARNSIYDIRRDLFTKTMELSGTQVDKYGLPSIISRMTSDSYNVQNFMRMIQTMGVRAPILLVGGLVTTFIMDRGLALVLFIIAPLVLLSVIFISKKGIPLYTKVQQAVDKIVRVMRENISGIRVVKALSKEQYETNRYAEANMSMYKADTLASNVMALPGPIANLFLNVGLTIVVVYGAYRVNGGLTKPGVILAFLTYFNMITNGVRGLNRIFIQSSKASASAERIFAVLEEGKDLETVYDLPKGKEYIAFKDVSFGYVKEGINTQDKELENINFSMERGTSLGIIGATGAGKTTIINLLMRFYDVDKGEVLVDGQNVKSYNLQELRRKFGVVFQNDIIFADTLMQNISFGRDIDEKRALEACEDALASKFVNEYEDGLMHKAEIHGANLSGGQKQRLYIARALANKPEILVLDDSSSALDYKTDANLRKTIREHYKDTTTIVVAQRISSIMSLDNILVLDDGKIVGQGTHEYLMETCSLYKEIYDVQMS